MIKRKQQQKFWKQMKRKTIVFLKNQSINQKKKKTSISSPSSQKKYRYVLLFALNLNYSQSIGFFWGEGGIN